EYPDNYPLPKSQTHSHINKLLSCPALNPAASMAFPSCLKCYSWLHISPPHHHIPSSYPKPTNLKFTLSLASSTHHHEPPLTAQSFLLNSTSLPPGFTAAQLLDTLRRQRDESAALRVYDWASKQPNFEPSPSIYEEILRKLGKVGSFDSMKDVLQEMKNSGCRATKGILLIFVESYADFGLHDDILGVLELLEAEFGLNPDTCCYNFLLNVLVDGNKLKLVETAHSRMVGRRIKPDVATFNILIKALCKAHQLRPAVLIMEDMHSHGLSPDEKTFTTLMQGFVEEGNVDGALRLKEQMLMAGCAVTHVTVNVLVRGFCKEGRVDEALGFIEKMSSEGFSPDKYTFNILVDGLCKIGHVKHALEVMDTMLQEGFDPDVYTYNPVISGLCKLGEIEEAMEILDQMIARDCSPDTVTCNTLINALCKENRVEEVAKFAFSLTSKGILPDVCMFNSLIQGLCLSQNHSAAMDLYKEMKNQGCEPDEYTYNTLIDSLCSRGKLKQALALLREMESSGCARDAVTYNTLIDGFCKSKRIKEAEEIFDDMEIQGVSRNSVTYNTLIDGYCKSRRMEDAAQLMDQMIMEGLKPDKFTYNSMLSHYCRVKDIKKAGEVFQTMASDGCEPDIVTYGTLIGGLCKAGRIPAAMTLLETIENKGMVLNPHVYNPVISALLRRKHTDEAMRLYREMLEKGNPPDAVTHKILFRELCNGGGPIREAVDFLIEMLDRGFLPEFSSFYKLAEGLLSLSMEGTLIRLVDTVMEKANCSEREVAMIRGFLKISKYQDALATLGGILDSRGPGKPYRRQRWSASHLLELKNPPWHAIDEEAPLVADDLPKKTKDHTRDVHILSSAFLLIFLAYGAAQNLETTINTEGNLGTISLGILYVSFTFFSLVASLVVRALGSKNAIVLGTTGYTMVPASLYLGFAASIIWVGEGTYLTSTARSHARDFELHEGTVIGLFNGEFWMMFASHQLIGNLISLFILRDGKYDFGNHTDVLLKYKGWQRRGAEFTKEIVTPAIGVSGVGGSMAVYGAFDAIEGAFAQLKVWQSASIAVVFFLSPYITLHAMLVIMLVGICASLAGFLFLILRVEKVLSTRRHLLFHSATWTILLTLTVAVASFSPELAFVSAISKSSSFSRACEEEGSVRIPLDLPGEVLCLPAHLFASKTVTDSVVSVMFAALVVAGSTCVVRALSSWESG
ncbi:hypothetical protein Tsubulata_035695, partial [Turnera subulata]